MKNKTLPERKNIRWDKQDYSHPGEYMITVCTKDMKQILSRVVLVKRGVEAPPPTFGEKTGFDKNITSENSVCLRSCDFEQTVGDGAPDVPCVQLTKYGKIVENHILNSNRINGLTVVKYVIMPNHVHILVRINCENKTEKTPANDTIPRFVGVLKRLTHRDIGEKIFQRSYHDHVIRDDNDFIGAVSYIENNPYRWTDKS